MGYGFGAMLLVAEGVKEEVLLVTTDVGRGKP